jgi:hypothetical protein
LHCSSEGLQRKPQENQHDHPGLTESPASVSV